MSGADPLLHPQMAQLIDGRNARRTIEATWRRVLPAARFPIAPRIVADTPWVGTRELLDALDARARHMATVLQSRLQACVDDQWGALPAADVLSVDLAVVTCPHTGRWDLRFVEVQAFTSIAASILLLAADHFDHFPELLGQRAWGREVGPTPEEWRRGLQSVLAPAGGIVLEHEPFNQGTVFDLEATSLLWDVPLVDPTELRRASGKLSVLRGVAQEPVRHILNRMIVHETAEPAAHRALLAGADVTWHSHPGWYYRIEKSILSTLELPIGERCLPAHRWRELGLPATELVLKAHFSCGGKDVFLHVDETRLERLENPAAWMVQPRYRPRGLLHASDGAPLYLEVRCMMALSPDRAPWLMGRIARVARGAKVSRDCMTGGPGEGLSLLYDPPD